MKIYAGIDAGSRAIKAVLADDRGRILASDVTDQGVQQADLAWSLFEKTLGIASLKRGDIARIVATGYGRDGLGFADTTMTEITCHAMGVSHVIPEVRTIIDIGGQDSKLMRMDGDGRVRDFVMNERCAAGTGRFLEVVARRFDIDLQELGDIACAADKPAAISSTCVVFAESEIIGLLAAGESRENIVAGVQASIASRIASMAGRGVVWPVVLTGGVALIPGMGRSLENALGHSVRVSPHPQMTGALGAALLAARRS